MHTMEQSPNNPHLDHSKFTKIHNASLGNRGAVRRTAPTPAIRAKSARVSTTRQITGAGSLRPGNSLIGKLKPPKSREAFHTADPRMLLHGVRRATDFSSRLSWTSVAMGSIANFDQRSESLALHRSYLDMTVLV
jgi:hypothetical protein